MKKKIWSILVVFILAITLLNACKKTSGMPDGVVEDEDTNDSVQTEEIVKFTFGYTCIDMSNPYFESLQFSIKTAVEEAGSELITYDATTDSGTQIQQVQQMIADGVNAVFLCPVDWEEIQPAIDALNEADIPIINIDTEVKDMDHVAAFVGSDNKNAGYVCGEDLINRRPNGGSVVVLECQTMNSVIERITGFEEAIAGSGFEVVGRLDEQGKKEAAQVAVAGVLAQNDSITAIMCGNDQMALGAFEAVTEANRNEILIYGIDGSPDVKKEIAKGTSPIVGTGAQSPINIGKTAVKQAFAILDNKEYEKVIYEDTFLIDHSNVGLYGTDGWQ